MTYVLTGAGHFGFGFILGASIALAIMLLFRPVLQIRLYAPFLPFLLGFLASLPYFFHYPKTCEMSPLMDFFVLYASIHCHYLAIKLLANLHLVVAICGLIYMFFLLHYILLVRHIRRFGWYSKERSHA